MLNKVFSIKGNKISSFISDDESLKFSSSKSERTIDSFKEAFAKKISLSTKVEIEYDSIKYIKIEDNDKNIIIRYKSFLGLPDDCEFSFNDSTDYDTFFRFLEKERYFTKTNERLTPFKAIKNYLIGFLATFGFTIFTYYQAIEFENGTIEEIHSGKSGIFNYVIGLLGNRGVLAVGISILVYLLYKIWTRFANPPNQLKFIPPNG